MKILDATSGSRSIWYQKKHPLVVFMDQRIEEYQDPRKDRYFVHRVRPMVKGQWENLPFKDETFDMIIFDPPHLIRGRQEKRIHLEMKYGALYSDNWKQVIKEGVTELFRVLKPNGFFIFKWNEVNKKVDEILKLFPFKPMFGTITGQKNNTHWITFIKYSVNMKLDIQEKL